MAEAIAVAVQPVIPGPNAPAPVTPPAERPAWLPEKFKTPEDFVKSYGELEKKIGTKVEAAPATPAVATPAAQPNVALDKYETEFSTTGALSDESYAELEKAGYPKSVVTNYITAQQQAASARQQQAESTIVSAAGSMAAYQEMTQWASQNLSTEQIEAFNANINSGSVEQVKLAVSGLKQVFADTFGVEPQLFTGRTGATDVRPFASTAEMSEAMRDKRYKNDPAYRKQVERRVAGM